MLLLWEPTLAAPCEFTGVTEETEVIEGLEHAYDADESTWMSGTYLSLGLTLAEDQWVETVGIMVQSDAEVTFDLDIWYLPEGGTKDVELFNDYGVLPEGTNRGRWNAGVEATELIYTLTTSAREPLGIQILCETGSPPPEYSYQGGGGCECGGGFGLAYAWMFSFPYLLRRRQRQLS